MQVPSSPPVIHIVGRKSSGKTELVINLIRILSARGYRIAGVRHSPHDHPLDAAGSDTAAYKKAGAIGSALITANETSLFVPATEWDEKLSCVRRTFSDCHLIIVEGGIKNGREKIEVIPSNEKPLCAGDKGLRALVGENLALSPVPCFSASDIEALCRFIETTYLKADISGAIVAGGKSSRLGVNKALLEIKGKTIIERVLGTVSALVSPIKIITNSPSEFKHLGLEMAADIRPGCGPLSGIHTALSMGSTEYVLVVSCDLPLLSQEVIRPLLSEYPGTDITMYKHKLFEPLCAIYRRTCLPALEELIDHGEYRIIDLFPTLYARIIRIEQGDAFQSINTPEDYQRILRKLAR